MLRVAAADDVIPLSEPIRTSSGKVLNELPVPKGMHLMLSVANYNRCV